MTDRPTDEPMTGEGQEPVVDPNSTEERESQGVAGARPTNAEAPLTEGKSGDPQRGEGHGEGVQALAGFVPGLAGRPRRSQALRKADSAERWRQKLTGQQRLLMLDTWMRSKLPATEFAPMVGISPHTLYQWKKLFVEQGPAGLSDKRRGGPRGSRLAEATRRAVLMMKEAHPEWGCERLHDMLVRTEGYQASATAISKLLHEEGYESEQVPTRSHRDKKRWFERARPNQLWQSDLFTFLLRRENRRMHLVVFLDDHSRFVVSHGLHATASGALVREALDAGLGNFGAPEEVLTDQGPQYYAWRGKSAFTKLLERRGIRHIVSRPRHPQTLGKVERFWGTLWRECLETALFRGLDDARRRVGHFIDHYNFQRTHQGLGGLVPADRYFSAAPEVAKALRQRVADNALELARHGEPRKSFYLAGRVGDEGISLHGEGERVILTKGDGTREEVDLKAPGRRAGPGEPTEVPEPAAVSARLEDLPATAGRAEEPAPGTSSLDEDLPRLEDAAVEETP